MGWYDCVALHLRGDATSRGRCESPLGSPFDRHAADVHFSSSQLRSILEYSLQISYVEYRPSRINDKITNTGLRNNILTNKSKKVSLQQRANTCTCGVSDEDLATGRSTCKQVLLWLVLDQKTCMYRVLQRSTGSISSHLSAG